MLHQQWPRNRASNPVSRLSISARPLARHDPALSSPLYEKATFDHHRKTNLDHEKAARLMATPATDCGDGSTADRQPSGATPTHPAPHLVLVPGTVAAYGAR